MHLILRVIAKSNLDSLVLVEIAEYVDHETDCFLLHFFLVNYFLLLLFFLWFVFVELCLILLVCRLIYYRRAGFHVDVHRLFLVPASFVAKMRSRSVSYVVAWLSYTIQVKRCDCSLWLGLYSAVLTSAIWSSSSLHFSLLHLLP